MEKSQRKHVALFGFPLASHPSVILGLALKLARLAPEVDFSFFSAPKSNRSLASVIASHGSLDNLKMYDVASGAPEDYVYVGNVTEELEMFLKAAPENLRRGLEDAMEEGGRVCSVISDAFLWSAGHLAEEMGVPWIALWCSSVCSLSSHYYTDVIRQIIGTDPQEVTRQLDKALDFVPGMSVFRARDLPDFVVFDSLSSYISDHFRKMTQQMQRASAIGVNTIQGLELEPVVQDMNSKYHNCLPIGHFTLQYGLPKDPDPNDSCLSWLDSLCLAPASVVYISFGTSGGGGLPPSELSALAEGLEVSGAHFLWSLKENMWDKLPNGFLERTKGKGMVVAWAPQSRVLQHVSVGAIVTHCGWNSLIESIMGGVPIIYKALFGDHKLNSQLVSQVWGIGVGVEGGVLTRDGVKDNIDLVLHKEEGKKMREKVQLLKEKAEHEVSESGSCTKNLNTLLEIVKGCRKPTAES